MNKSCIFWEVSGKISHGKVPFSDKPPHSGDSVEKTDKMMENEQEKRLFLAKILVDSGKELSYNQAETEDKQQKRVFEAVTAWASPVMRRDI